MKLENCILPLALGSLAVSAAYAHSPWINLVPEPVEGHVITSLAYGDFMPGSELLTNDWGNVTVDRYELVAPDGARTSLGLPVLKPSPKKGAGNGVTVQPETDIGIRKVVFGPESSKGTYQLFAQSSVYQYIVYRDRKGEKRYSDQPYSTLEDVAKVESVSRDVYFMKAVHASGAWSEPAALGAILEIVPLTDLSSAKPGDLVRFKVLRDGAAWTTGGDSALLTAFSPAYGDRWGIQSSLKYGEAEFRLPVGGAWRVAIHFKGRSGDYPKLVPAARGEPVPGVKSEDVDLYVQTSLVFNVKP
jgi:hypothetical protein